MNLGNFSTCWLITGKKERPHNVPELFVIVDYDSEGRWKIVKIFCLIPSMQFSFKINVDANISPFAVLGDSEPKHFLMFSI